MEEVAELTVVRKDYKPKQGVKVNVYGNVLVVVVGFWCWRVLSFLVLYLLLVPRCRYPPCKQRLASGGAMDCFVARAETTQLAVSVV